MNLDQIVAAAISPLASGILKHEEVVKVAGTTITGAIVTDAEIEPEILDGRILEITGYDVFVAAPQSVVTARNTVVEIGAKKYRVRKAKRDAVGTTLTVTPEKL